MLELQLVRIEIDATARREWSTNELIIHQPKVVDFYLKKFGEVLCLEFRILDLIYGGGMWPLFQVIPNLDHYTENGTIIWLPMIEALRVMREVGGEMRRLAIKLESRVK